MKVTDAGTIIRVTSMLTTVVVLTACTTTETLDTKSASSTKTKLNTDISKQVYTYTAKDRDCLKRAMYFESKRTSELGFLAVGSVIMNRLTSGIYPPTICGVVSQNKQFAPGVMTRTMDQASAPALETTADAILQGKRHPDVKEAMYFHQKGLRFRYDNMHYTAAAGGNVFYEKRDENGVLQTAEPKPADQYVLAYAGTIVPQSGIALGLDKTGTMNAPVIDDADSLDTASTTPRVAVSAETEGMNRISELAGLGVTVSSDASIAAHDTASKSDDPMIQTFDLVTSVPIPIERPTSKQPD